MACHRSRGKTMTRESEGVEDRAMRVRDATLESTTEARYPEPPDREVK
jgi:hypothetical protein